MCGPISKKTCALTGWNVPAFSEAKDDPPGSHLGQGADPDLEYTVLKVRDRFFLSFGTLASFSVSFADRLIELADTSGTDDPASLDHLLYDHVIPRVIAASGKLVLHGSAVEIGGRLALFIGETGAGKSTLSASLHREGHRLLGDDAVIISSTGGTFFGEAVYPSLRLYPNSIEQVLGEDVATARMAHYSDKRHVTGFSAGTAPAGPLPIGHIFFLGGEYHEPCVESVPLRDVCMALIEQSFALDPCDIAAAGERMRQSSALAAAVPADALYYPHDYAILPQVHRLIADTIAAAAHPAKGNIPR